MGETALVTLKKDYRREGIWIQYVTKSGISTSRARGYLDTADSWGTL
jgi:hypothetical protein